MNPRYDILERFHPGEAARYFAAIRIGSTPESADEGAALILDGTKTATSSAFWDYPDGRLPFAGALAVLLDGRQRAVAIVETTHVRAVRFGDVSEAMARTYGEGERTLAWWRRVIGEWYRSAAARHGQHFDDASEILWESLKVVRRLPLNELT